MSRFYRRRIWAMVAALLLHGVIVSLLGSPSVTRVPVGTQPPMSARFLPRPSEPASQQTAPFLHSAPAPSVRPSSRNLPSVAAPEVASTVEAATQGIRPNATADTTNWPQTQPAPVEIPVAEQLPAPQSPAVAPLRIDSQVLRAAAAQSIGTVRRMAEASAAQLPSVQVSAAINLEAGVSTAVKPSCTAPNARGSLLSVAYLAFAALAQHCN